MNLKDKVVVITGASKGIGKSLAVLFANKGAQVVASDRSDTDVRKEADVQALAKRTVAEFGRIDIWINNAGVLHAFDEEDTSVDMEKAREIFDVNFFGTVFGSRAALRYMQSGCIVNIISRVALDATKAENLKLYAASKWATRGYTQAFAAENKNPEIKILAVFPGGTQTELWREWKPANVDEFMAPDYVAKIIVENLEKENPEGELVIKRPTM